MNDIRREGIGRYDDEAARVVKSTDARDGVIVMVLNGRLGSGFSVAATPDTARMLPALLRQIADDIEASPLPLQEGGSQVN